MKLSLRYLPDQQEAVFAWSEDGPWSQLRSILLAGSSQVTTASSSIRVPWYVVLGAWDPLGEFFALNPNVKLELDQHATLAMQGALGRRREARSTFDEGRSQSWSASQLEEALRAVGFARPLKPFQRENARILCGMNAGATFSVPGAGKTTEALAYFFATAHHNDRLLVLAPKNAFSAWDDALSACMPRLDSKFVRLVGGETQIDRLLAAEPKLMLMAYSQLARDPIPDLVSSALLRGDCYVFLDESHRIKHGSAGKAGQAVLRLSSLPKRKLILSGTPMPQSYEDLVPQFAFLFPEVQLPADSKIVDVVRPVFVRTTKRQLGLPDASPPRIYNVPMSDAQARLNALLHEDLRRLAPTMSRGQKLALRRLRRKVLRLIQLNANPAIVATWEDESIESSLLEALLAEPYVKLDEACNLARKLASEDEKVLVWTNFRSTILALKARLRDLDPEFIDGSVDAGDAEDQESREGRIQRFSSDRNCKVLIANPMAAAEGISLHTVCRHAIYVDRTFNAGQYLQSLDRIHRIGMPEGWIPTWHVLMHAGSIDEIVDTRLRLKIDRMAGVLNDPDLKTLSGEWVELGDEDEITEELVLGADIDDLLAATRR